MGGEGSGRKQSFKTKLILYALDEQIFLTNLIRDIEEGKLSSKEILDILFKRRKLARKTCEENEVLKERA